MQGPETAAAGRTGWPAWLRHLADRGRDKPLTRPADIAYALEERPPRGQTLALALQQLAIQAIYFLLPGLVGAAFGMAVAEITHFLCLTVAVLGLTAILQGLARGPIGSGYPLPAIPSPVILGVYLLLAENGNPAVAGSLVMLAGLLGLLLAVLLRRLQALVPTEVAGVVVFLIGVSLLPRAFEAITPPTLPLALHLPAALVTLASLAAMILVALQRGRIGRFGVLVGGLLGGALSAMVGLLPAGAGAQLAAAPWFALPVPQPPGLAGFDWSLVPALVVALLASFASWTGDLVAFQRAADGDWRRPDAGPIRRGLAAQSLGLVAAGLLGGMAPSSSSACVGLAIATRTLSRVVALAGAALLLLLACCPKLVTLFVVVPDPVKAAMLGYVCCFMLASGCRLMTARMLDARRTFTIGLGLAVGLGVLIEPGLFATALPRALHSPVTAGALVAVLLNLVTSPLVALRASFAMQPGPRLPQAVVDRCEALGGAWGLRRETMDRVQHSLLELGEILAGRGIAQAMVQARFEEEQVFLTLAFPGEPLPRPSARPDIGHLTGPLEAQEAFAMWMATRGANSFGQRRSGEMNELRLEFAD